jgi:hypothetical protein
MGPRLRRRALLFTLAFLVAVTSRAQEIVERLPAATNLIVRIRVDALLKSPVVEQVLNEEHARYLAVDETLRELFGFRLANIRTLWFVATRPENNAVLLEGRFDGSHVADRLSRAPLFVEVPDAPVVQLSRFTDVADGRDKRAAVLDDSRLCFGDADAVQKIIDAWTGQSEPRPSGDPALERLTSSPSQVLATLLDASSWQGFDAGMGALFEQVWLRGEFTADASTTLEVETVEERAARGLAELARGLLILGARNPDLAEYPHLLESFSTADVQQDDTRFALTLLASKDDIRHALDRTEN